MTAELYRGRKTSSFQFEGEMVSGFNAGNRIGTGKRASIDWSRENLGAIRVQQEFQRVLAAAVFLVQRSPRMAATTDAGQVCSSRFLRPGGRARS